MIHFQIKNINEDLQIKKLEIRNNKKEREHFQMLQSQFYKVLEIINLKNLIQGVIMVKKKVKDLVYLLAKKKKEQIE